MHEFVSLNFQIFSADKSFIPALSPAALYGKGVFTTLAIYGGKPFLWEKHWRRLRENSARLNIDLTGLAEETVKNALLNLVLKNGFETGRARLTFFDQSVGGLWNFKSSNKTGLLMTTADLRELKSELRLTVSPFPVNSGSPLVNLKSCNYLENLLALEDARKKGFDEAVRLNEKGEIVSAAMANIFWVKDEKLFTPDPETGCLLGTMREYIAEKFPVFEVKSGLNVLSDADEIFLTSAGIGICPANFENAPKKSFPTVSKLAKLLDLKRVKA